MSHVGFLPRLLAAALVLAVLLTAAQVAWHHIGCSPVLLADAAPADRTRIYGQLTGSAVALLAVALTVLAILTALPDRPGVAALRKEGSVLDLSLGLLMTAAVCLALLVLAHIGSAADNDADAKEAIAYPTFAFSGTAIVGCIYFGLAFGLALRRGEDPPNPGLGRGDG